MRKFFRWYWFHCKRAFDLHEGRAGFFKRRPFNEYMLSVWSFAIMTFVYKLFLVLLLLVLVGGYRLYLLFA